MALQEWEKASPNSENLSAIISLKEKLLSESLIYASDMEKDLYFNQNLDRTAEAYFLATQLGLPSRPFQATLQDYYYTSGVYKGSEDQIQAFATQAQGQNERIFKTSSNGYILGAMMYEN